MFVSETLVGTVVTAPDLRYTSRGVPVANLAVTTSPGAPASDAVTWVVKAYASLATEVMDSVSVGEALIVTGLFAASDPFVGRDGRTRTRIECRAQSIAPAIGAPSLDPVFSLRGTVATVPELLTDRDDGEEPLVELDVRTSRFKRGKVTEEADVTYWPVSAVGEMAQRMADWRVGDSVVVAGRARPLIDPPPETPQVEIWAMSAGVDLHPQDAHPDAKLARPGRAAREGGVR